MALLALQATVGTVHPAAASQPGVPGDETAAQPARVVVDFLADGRCTVSSTGAGFRSKVTYKPEGEARHPGELRCAFPPVQAGMQVALTVTLPAGAAEPGPTRPALQWSSDHGRWIGTALLTAWPEVIVVTPVDRPLLFWVTAGLALLIASLAARRWLVARHRPQASAPAASAAA